MVLTLLIVVFLFLMHFLWLYIDEFAGKGLSWGTIFEILGWNAITNVPMALPLSTLLASLMTMGNLGENNELLALKASGISLNRILYSLYFAIVLLAIGAFFLSSDFAPYAYLQMRTKLQKVRKTNPELSIPEGIFYNGIDGYSIRVDKKDPKTGTLMGVMIYNHSQGDDNYSVTIADSAYIKQTKDSRYIILRLINGSSYEDELKNKSIDKKNYPFNRREFKEQIIAIDLGVEDDRSYEYMFKDLPMAKTLKSLTTTSDSVQHKRDSLMSYFRDTQLDNSSSFKYTIKQDTARKRVKEFNHNTDSIYNASSALKKVEFLNTAEANALRTIGYWENEVRQIQAETKSLKNVNFERNRKFTLAFSCIIFFFIGAPLGAIIRKGGLGLPIVISVFFFVFYWVIDTISRKLVQNGDLSPFVGAWFSSFILVPLAAFLTYKANTDSQLFNPDAYKKFFNRLFGRMKKLIDPIDLDKVKPMSDAQREEAFTHNNENTKKLTELINNYLETHKLSKAFQSRKTIISMDHDKELAEIKDLYDDLLSYYATIYDDNNIRETIKNFPVLDLSEFSLSKSFTTENVLLRIPNTLIQIFIKSRKFKKLKYILENIKDINLNVNKYINGRDKA